jgi:hypothetical protein
MRFYNATGPATHYCLQLSDGELVAGANISLVTAHSNIRITSVATGNGSWSLLSNTYTFTPTADNANISVTDLQNYLRSYSVEIKTSRAAGTQVGSVVFDVDVIPNKNSDAGVFDFTIRSGGEVQFNSNLSLRNAARTFYPGYNLVVVAGGSVRVGGVLDVSGSTNGDGYTSFPSPGSVSMVIGGDLTVFGTGQVLSRGISNTYPSNNFNGGAGGSQSYVVSGGVDLRSGSVLSSVGGGSNRSGSYTTTAGAGGSIGISGVNGLLLRGSIQSVGGSGYQGGVGGALTISSSASYVDYGGVLSSAGGDGFASYVNAGNGGNISISGFGGLSLRGDVNASVGLGIGIGGNINLSDGNGVLTAGGGVNDGLVGGVLYGNNLDKEGVGVIGLGGIQVYKGATTIKAGRVVLLSDKAIPVVSNLSLYPATELDLNGKSITLASMGGELTCKVTNGDATPVTLKFGGSAAFRGLIEDGVGVVKL